MTDQYYQVRLERETPGSVQVMMGWVEARAAKVGAEVELMPSRQLWKVGYVHNDVVVDKDHVKEMEANYRAGMPSTRDPSNDKGKKAHA